MPLRHQIITAIAKPNRTPSKARHLLGSTPETSRNTRISVRAGFDNNPLCFECDDISTGSSKWSEDVAEDLTSVHLSESGQTLERLAMGLVGLCRSDSWPLYIIHKTLDSFEKDVAFMTFTDLIHCPIALSQVN